MPSRRFATAFPVRRAVIAVGMIALIFLGGAVGYQFLGAGRWAWSDSLYMTALTISTVGFREVVPVGDDPVLRAYTVVLIFAGGGSMVYLLSIVTAFLVEGDLNQIIRRRRMDKEIAGMHDHYVVCGVGRNGEHAAARLLAEGLRVVLIDRSEDQVRAFVERTGQRTAFVVGDATDEAVLARAGVERARGLVAALPDDPDNIFLILSARGVNPRLRIVSKVNEKRSRDKFLQVGADAVVSPAAMGGLRMFSEMVRPGVVSFLDTALHEAAEGLAMDEVVVGAGSDLDGVRLADSEIRRRLNLLVVGVRDAGSGRFTYNPGPDVVLAAGMTLILLGPTASIAEIRKREAGQSGG